jgi:hypothetical protein
MDNHLELTVLRPGKPSPPDFNRSRLELRHPNLTGTVFNNCRYDINEMLTQH